MTLIGPVVAVEGTVAVIWVAEFTTNVAVTLLKVTPVVVKLAPLTVPLKFVPVIFTDVPVTNPFAPWIETLFLLGITGGCSVTPALYCPQNPVRRDQMAVFLLKTRNGSGYLPPGCTGVFDDVQCPSQFADWIEQLADEEITGGCSVSPPLYCPLNNNTRGQMAVFITKTFNLQ